VQDPDQFAVGAPRQHDCGVIAALDRFFAQGGIEQADVPENAGPLGAWNGVAATHTFHSALGIGQRQETRVESGMGHQAHGVRRVMADVADPGKVIAKAKRWALEPGDVILTVTPGGMVAASSDRAGEADAQCRPAATQA
jgi:hypothetical protein